ncbi:MAG TPA: hypothetical protein VK888_10335 [Anaerolineales bacterium]|nr:hypothetical protein [Anaerolineales bacterium]
MTRVILSLSVLEYCEAMAELVREVCEKPTITGVAPRRRREEWIPARKDLPAFRLDGLLGPPRIEMIVPCLFAAEEQVDGIIEIIASGAYGVMNVYVILEDDQGNQMESGFALKDKVEEDEWFYFPSVSLRSGASVTVRAMAMDPLGGVGIQDENVTV